MAVKRQCTNGRIVATSRVLIERLNSTGRIVAAGGIMKERDGTDGGVEVPRIGVERSVTGGRVIATFDVEKQRLITISRVAITCRVAKERLLAIGCVKAALCVAEQSKCSISRVLEASGIAQKRSSAGSRVFISGIGQKRPGTNRCIEVTFQGAYEREETNRRIVCAACETKKRTLPLRCVATGITSIRWRINCLRFWKEPNAGERECNDTEVFSCCLHRSDSRKKTR